MSTYEIEIGSPIPKIGSQISTEDQARILPVGSVVIHPRTGNLATKISDERWLISRISGNGFTSTTADPRIRGEFMKLIYLPEEEEEA